MNSNSQAQETTVIYENGPIVIHEHDGIQIRNGIRTGMLYRSINLERMNFYYSPRLTESKIQRILDSIQYVNGHYEEHVAAQVKFRMEGDVEQPCLMTHEEVNEHLRGIMRKQQDFWSGVYRPNISSPQMIVENEQGTICYFSQAMKRDYWEILKIRTSFPDAILKRVHPFNKVYRTEFEYASINFRAHGHNPEQCDLIVCWEHNWKDCPLPVIELSNPMWGYGDVDDYAGGHPEKTAYKAMLDLL